MDTGACVGAGTGTGTCTSTGKGLGTSTDTGTGMDTGTYTGGGITQAWVQGRGHVWERVQVQINTCTWKGNIYTTYSHDCNEPYILIFIVNIYLTINLVLSQHLVE